MSYSLKRRLDKLEKRAKKLVTGCDYCTKESIDLEEFKSCDGTIRHLKIVFVPEMRHLQVRIKDHQETAYCYGIDTRFNYCPMCGKKLK